MKIYAHINGMLHLPSWVGIMWGFRLDLADIPMGYFSDVLWLSWNAVLYYWYLSFDPGLCHYINLVRTNAPLLFTPSFKSCDIGSNISPLTLQDGEQGCIQGEKDHGISKWSTYQMIFHTSHQIPPHTTLTWFCNVWYHYWTSSMKNLWK